MSPPKRGRIITVLKWLPVILAVLSFQVKFPLIIQRRK
jgi:hypothetical protein